jgi:hypothetical protein
MNDATRIPELQMGARELLSVYVSGIYNITYVIIERIQAYRPTIRELVEEFYGISYGHTH